MKPTERSRSEFDAEVRRQVDGLARLPAMTRTQLREYLSHDRRKGALTFAIAVEELYFSEGRGREG